MAYANLSAEEIELLLTTTRLALHHPAFIALNQKLGALLGENERDRQIVTMAQDKFASEGEVEIDDYVTGMVSEGEDNGAYVLTWRWVSFEGTSLDKDDLCSECGEELGGDGYDGLCGECADRITNEVDGE